ncbi:16320_t:CDS:2, partial [Funneliformis geosporum]
LSFLSHLTNLKHLEIQNDDEQRIEQGIINYFFGSLGPLKNIDKLKYLNIDNTVVDFGLEYLPTSLKQIACQTNPELKEVQKNNNSYKKQSLKIVSDVPKNKQDSLLLPTYLPIKLYNIKTNRDEKADEVRKMRKCYGEGEVTLISINTEVKDKNENAERLLSKETIFMFDDELVDGLFQALSAVKNRGRGIPIDGIYSILGLLPYDEKIKVQYKPKICPRCPNQEETKDCTHNKDSKKYPIYTKEELEKNLIDIVKIAIEEGHPEPLT